MIHAICQNVRRTNLLVIEYVLIFFWAINLIKCINSNYEKVNWMLFFLEANVFSFLKLLGCMNETSLVFNPKCKKKKQFSETKFDINTYLKSNIIWSSLDLEDVCKKQYFFFCFGHCIFLRNFFFFSWGWCFFVKFLWFHSYDNMST